MMSSSTTKACFNSNCKAASETWKRGWRRRTGEYANLCDRCASAYVEGKFCETFHMNGSGWRCCESCGKQIHCGCIVSFHMFVLLDAGGIECLTCAKKSYILTPNPAWPPPSHSLSSQPERMNHLSFKDFSAIAGPVPWRQAPSLLNGFDMQSNVQQRIPFEIDISGGNDRNGVYERLSTSSPEMKQGCTYERLINGKLRLGPFETLENGNTGLKEQSHPFINNFKPVFSKKDSSSNLNLATDFSSRIETDNSQPSDILSQQHAGSAPLGKQVYRLNEMDSSSDGHLRNAKARDGRARNQLLPRYRPQITGEELQKLLSDSKSVITPLFEKMLSASDAGRIGRLVLPKKCAEAYFPPISQPEGLPLRVQDVKGKEWVFQFRFWPNNNSRMYVLEGITPCIQSMQLQAGDVVTFSRLEPEGKLVMGGRKTSVTPSSDQGEEVTTMGSDASIPGDGSAINKSGDVISVNGNMKEKTLEDNPTIHSKRKNKNLGAKSKRLKIENEDMVELKVTWKEAQALIRSPAKIVPSCFIVEGCEFEEFEEAEPVIGRPTIPGIDHFGVKIQWVQCEDCFKWRKVPVDALLSSRWVCSENTWDTDRSLCSSPEELTKELLEHMLPTINKDSSEITEQDVADLSVALEGLDTLADLAIQGEGDPPLSSSENRTKHPRHKPGCSCIVCLQPPSGKGPKHDQSCDCVVCSSVKRRFKTLTERRKKKLLEKGATQSQSPSQNQQLGKKNTQDVENSGGLNPEDGSKLSDLDENGRKPATSPLKGQVIDLNIQPEDLSPASGSGPAKCSPTGPTESLFGPQQSLLGADVVGGLLEKKFQQDGVGSVNLVSCVAAFEGGHQKAG